MKVLVLGGGDSPEHDVSVRSAKAVADAARIAGFDILEADPAKGYSILDNLPSGTIVLPVLHGLNGEDGVIQKELEERGLPFLGSGSKSSSQCFDKWQTRQVLESANIRMPKAVKVSKETYENQPMSKTPHVLKIINGGSSIGTLIVRDPSALKAEQVDNIFSMQNDAVIEELIEGNEITVPVLDKQALSVIEIIPPKDLEFDYENKYNGATQEIVPPKNISLEIQEKAQELASQVHKIMDCRHLSRTDFMVDATGNIFALEINTMPGLTNQSLFPKAAAVSGMDMPALVTKFIDMVKRDYKL